MCEAMLERPRLFVKRPHYSDDSCRSLLENPEKSVLGHLGDPHCEEYRLVCMLTGMDAGCDLLSGATYKK